MAAIFTLETCFLVNHSISVMVSHDTVYLYEGTKRINDNSVICKLADEHRQYFYVYKNGKHKNMQTIQPVKYVFFKTNKDILNYFEWKKKNKKSTDPQAHTDYLAEQAKNAVYSCEIIIPARTDNKTYGAPNGMKPGGIIGSNRYFNLDLKKCELKQLSR